MKLSVIVPVYNEINTISNILKKLIFSLKRINSKIIIVDDCSIDGTREWLIKNIKKNQSNIIVVFKNKNEGKGSAIIEGIKYVKLNDLILIQDADLEYFPKDIPRLLNQIKKGYDVVFGNRFHKLSHYHYKTFALANFFISKIVSILYLRKISDVAVCYKIFHKKVVNKIKINSKDFMFDFEFASKIIKNKKLKISEINISYKGRTFKEGKKISWVDGFRALFLILKIRILG